MRVALLSGYLMAGVVATAQGQAAICGVSQVDVKAGSFAEYASTSPRGAGTVKLAMLGQETKDGKSLSRIEMQSVTGPQSSTIQVLTEHWPYTLTEAKEVVIQSSGRPATKVSGPMLQMMQQRMQQGGGTDFKAQCGSLTLVGPETIAVPAGSMKTSHYHNDKTASDIWVSADVPFLLVKSSGKDFALELKGTGTGATSTVVMAPEEAPGGGGTPGAAPAKKKVEEPCNCTGT